MILGCMCTDTMLKTWFVVGFFLLASVLSHEKLPYREVQSCCDAFRTTDTCRDTQIISPAAVFILFLVF